MLIKTININIIEKKIALQDVVGAFCEEVLWGGLTCLTRQQRLAPSRFAHEKFVKSYLAY